MIGARKKKFTPKMRFHMIYNTRHQSRWKLLTDTRRKHQIVLCLKEELRLIKRNDREPAFDCS